jgi:hypothetical protein
VHPKEAETETAGARESNSGVEGPQHIEVNSVSYDGYFSQFKEITQVHKVPEKLLFSAFHRLRMTALIPNPTMRVTLTRIRFLAAAALRMLTIKAKLLLLLCPCLFDLTLTSLE